jgi:hypothetical protein
LLELLASRPEGCTEAIMQAHGFDIEQMAELICRAPEPATPRTM